MFAFGATLILVHFLPTFYAQHATTILNSSITSEAEAGGLADVLSELQPNEVLPLVLFEERQTIHPTLSPLDVLQFPKDIEQAVIINRRMVKGTKFTNLSDTQVFFCPKQDAEDECLAPQKFDDLELLECAKEPSPVIRPDKGLEGTCGGTGYPYYITYDICPEESPYKYVTREIPFYVFCYDDGKKNTLFAIHYIPSPNLLKSFLLFRERSVKYPIIINDRFKPSNLNVINIPEILELNSIVHPENPSYKLQMLVPEANMALALWRKTTYRNFNLEWQHEALIPLWNQINHYVTSHASQLSINNTKLLVRTGVIDVDPESKNDSPTSKIWVNMITTMPSNDHTLPLGIVILMNNFIRNPANANGDSSTISVAEEAIKSYCEEDLCIDALKEKFNEVGGSIRCCNLSKNNAKVRKLFDFKRSTSKYDDILNLRIPHVTTRISNWSIKV